MNWKLNKVARQYRSLQSLFCSHQCRREGGDERSVSNEIFPMWKMLTLLQKSPAEGFPLASDLTDKASEEYVFRSIVLRPLQKETHYSLLQQSYRSGKSPKTYITSFVAGLPKD